MIDQGPEELRGSDQLRPEKDSEIFFFSKEIRSSDICLQKKNLEKKNYHFQVGTHFSIVH